MKFGKTKRIFVSVIAALMTFIMLFSTLVAYAAEELPNNYIIDNAGVLSQYDVDLIDTVGKELEKSGVKLIAVVEKELLNEDANAIIKNQYFNWYGQLDKDTKLVVLNYYVNENKLVIFDDGQNYISTPYLLKLQGDLELYKEKQDMESGMYYLYSAIAESIGKDLNVTLVSSDSTLKYEKDIWFKSMPAIFGVLIIVVLVFSFRRKKDK